MSTGLVKHFSKADALEGALLCHAGDLHRPGNFAVDSHLCNRPDINQIQSAQKVFCLVFLSFVSQRPPPNAWPPTNSVHRVQIGPCTIPPHPFTRSETLRLRKHWTGSENTHVKSKTVSASTNAATMASNCRSLIICKHARIKSYCGEQMDTNDLSPPRSLSVVSFKHVHPATSPTELSSTYI